MLDYLLVYEHRARELENLCLLKAELENRGKSVVIVQNNSLNLLRYRFWDKPKVFVTFALYDDASFKAHVTGIVGKIKKVVNMQCEQLIANNSTDVYYHTPREKAAHAVHICWGEDSYKRLQDSGVKNSILTGAIQMDFLQGRLREYYMSRTELFKKYGLPNKRMLLYISSFVITTRTEQEILIDENKIGSVVRERQENALLSKKKTLEIFKRYLHDNTDCIIVYRPHPGELMDKDLIELEQQFPSFRVIANESVKQWILAANDVITWISTAAAEVYFAHRNCLILRPVSVPVQCDNSLFEHAHFISDYNGFIRELDCPERPFPIPDDDIKKSYVDVDDKPAFTKIADILEEVLNSTKYDMNDCQNGLYLFDHFKRLIKKLIITLRISSKTWPFSRIHIVQDRLVAFETARKKISVEEASDEEIDQITERLKRILQKG